MAELNARKITVTAKEVRLVHDASIDLASGELVVLLGPNGAGKTSLIRAMVGLETPTTGQVSICGDVMRLLNPLQRARRLSYLPQARPLAWPSKVRDVVALGRYSHGVTIGRLRGIDVKAVDRAIASCDLTELADRNTDTLSGGELARVHCARAFATEAPLLIADEPTAALDPRHQFRVMNLVRSFVDAGGGALVVLHDIQFATKFASRFVWMKAGRIVADGSPKETLTADRISSIYGVKAKVDGFHVEMEGAL